MEVAVVGGPAKFDAALRRTKDCNGVVRRAQAARDARFAVNVIGRKIDGLCLREGQIHFKLSEPYVQRILRQANSTAQVAVFQPAISHEAIGIGSADGDVIIDPKREVRPKASCTDNGERVGGKEVCPWRK